MNSKRAIEFDKNRNLGVEIFSNMTELENKIQQLQQIVQQQEQKIMQQELQQQALMQQAQNAGNEQQGTNVMLNHNHVQNQFRHIRPFDGSKDYSLTSFIDSVESTVHLCGNNMALIQYGLSIVKNEKVLGQAGRSVRKLGNDPTWDAIKAKLKEHFAPRTTYAELFNYCRHLKVTNLRELFSEFREINFKINELYEFDYKKPNIYSPENVERDLAEILIDKIDGNIRAHIHDETTLTEIFNKYSRLKLPAANSMQW